MRLVRLVELDGSFVSLSGLAISGAATPALGQMATFLLYVREHFGANSAGPDRAGGTFPDPSGQHKKDPAEAEPVDPHHKDKKGRARNAPCHGV